MTDPTPLIEEKNRTVGNHFKKEKERWVDIRTAVRQKSILMAQLSTVVLFLFVLMCNVRADGPRWCRVYIDLTYLRLFVEYFCQRMFSDGQPKSFFGWSVLLGKIRQVIFNLFFNELMKIRHKDDVFRTCFRVCVLGVLQASLIGG